MRDLGHSRAREPWQPSLPISVGVTYAILSIAVVPDLGPRFLESGRRAHMWRVSSCPEPPLTARGSVFGNARLQGSASAPTALGSGRTTHALLIRGSL